MIIEHKVCAHPASYTLRGKQRLGYGPKSALGILYCTRKCTENVENLSDPGYNGSVLMVLAYGRGFGAFTLRLGPGLGSGGGHGASDIPPPRTLFRKQQLPIQVTSFTHFHLILERTIFFCCPDYRFFSLVLLSYMPLDVPSLQLLMCSGWSAVSAPNCSKHGAFYSGQNRVLLLRCLSSS